MSAAAANLLRAAADRIERDGWYQGGSGSDGKRCCMMVALARETDKHDDAWEEAVDAICGAVSPLVPFEWNDAPERTRDEVIALLRNAATQCGGTP